jgi:Bax protein
MRRLTLCIVCFLASFIGASVVPVDMSAGMNIPDEYLAAGPVVGYAYTASLPDGLFRAEEGQERKRMLVEVLLPMVLRANEAVLAQRGIVEEISKDLPSLDAGQKEVLDALARMYHVQATSPRETVRELLARVDALPPSLVLAQAAVESGWGTSRFSHEGNNIFGLRTQSGNGMIPQERPDQESYAVSTFEDLQSCIDYYLWNINTNPLYEDLRRIRSRSARQCGGLDLARGLVCYSEQGPAYVSKLEKLISANSLSEYDGYRLK